MKEQEFKLSLNLRRYLLNNKISSVFINFDKSLIKETYDGRGFNKAYQILVLEKPEPEAFEIETLEWPYSSEKVLLICDAASEKISVFPLEFSFKTADKLVKSSYNFSNYQSLKICEKHILITTLMGGGVRDNRCLAIVLLNVDGTIVSVWKTENVNSYKSEISDFHQLEDGHWIVNLTFDQRISGQIPVNRLCLLSLNNSFALKASLEDERSPKMGTLLNVKTKEIKACFGPEVNGCSSFFVLASNIQCCVYFFNEKNNCYDKIADIILDPSFVNSIYNVSLFNNKVLSIDFNNKKITVKSPAFNFLPKE